jgi:uncharacterized protein YegL
MTNPNYAHCLLIVDHSGSMQKIKDDAEGGVNQFVRDMAALPGKVTISLVEFDTTHDRVLDFADARTAPEYKLTPRGGTALLDAIGFAVTQEGEKLAAMPEDERPDKVAALIATDGRENASVEYTKPQVKELLVHQQEKYGWAVSYIGANVNSFAEAREMGIPLAATMDYAASGTGTRKAYGAASSAVRSYVGGQSAGISYTDADRDAAADKK